MRTTLKHHAIAATLLGTAMFMTACEVDVEEEGELPDVDVTTEAGQMPAYDIEQTREGEMPDVDVDATGGQLPEVDVRGPDIDVERETVTVPDVDVQVDEEEVSVPTLDIDPAEERAEPNAPSEARGE
jgi:hypothetical protein